LTGESTPANAAGFVLAGGRSTRFGRDKALVPIGDEVLLSRLCSVMRLVTPNVAIIGSQEKYGDFGVECIEDRWPGEGPLGGIITAIRSRASTAGAGIPASSRRNLIIGCDMPFLSREWLEYLVEWALTTDAEVVAPKSLYGLEPLCACWRTSAADALQDLFEHGVRKVTEGMKHLKMEVLDETHWKRFDNADRLFRNMNTPEDYEEAKRVLEAERS
jgi:molybdenum cofactor guanylyltransferase